MILSNEVKNIRAIKRYKTVENDFIKFHGDKYDYSMTCYKNVKTKIMIWCNTHKEFFWQNPQKHLECGCPKCGRESTTLKQRKTKEQFVKEAREIHGDKYIYDKVDYKKNNIKVTITCPIHGDFKQEPYVHLSDNGCPKCGVLKRRETRLKPVEYFIKEANEKHNNKYDYSKVKYYNTHTKVTITCKEHGDFKQEPASHLSDNGCPKCGRETGISKRIRSDKQFIKEAREIHGDKYDYSKTEYKRVDKKVTITCPIHGDFKQTPHGHLSGKGCFKCGREFIKRNIYKKYYNEPTILYYIKIEKEGFPVTYKIGITKNSVIERYKSEKNIKYTILSEEHFDTGKEAFNKEQLIINSFEEYKYCGDDVFDNGGNSELFIEDCYEIIR